MRFVWFLLLMSVPAGAELPYSTSDTPTSENLEYLDQQLRKLNVEVNSLPTQTSGYMLLTATQAPSGGNTFAGAVAISSSLAISIGADCSGMYCRVGYSSGTASSFAFPLASSTTYRLWVSVNITSGASTAQGTMRCTFGSTSAGDYYFSGTSYPNAYVLNSAGAVAYMGFMSCGAGDIGASSFTGTLDIAALWGRGRIMANGQSAGDCPTAGQTQTQSQAWAFLKPPPVTLVCYPVAPLGWEYEAIIYKVAR